MALFACTSGGNFAVGSGAKTILNLISGSDSPPYLTEFGISFDGTTASNPPVLVELCASTQAGAGTTGTIGTVVMKRGYPSFTARSTMAGQYSAEPTVLVAFKQWFVRSDGGPFVIQNPLGREAMGMITASTSMKGIALRVSATSGTPNARAYYEFEE